MSTYKYTYCPYCNKMLDFDRSEFYFYERHIDIKYRRCPHCNNIYKTGKKLYFQMNSQERKNIKYMYYMNIISNSLTIFVILFTIIILLLSVLVDDFTFDIYTGIVSILLFIFSFVVGYKISLANYNKIRCLRIDDFQIDNELKTLLKNDNQKNS